MALEAALRQVAFQAMYTEFQAAGEDGFGGPVSSLDRDLRAVLMVVLCKEAGGGTEDAARAVREVEDAPVGTVR